MLLLFHSKENTSVFIFIFYNISFGDLANNKNFLIFVPVCTMSPISSSNIVTDFLFLTLTVAADGKQLLLLANNIKWILLKYIRWQIYVVCYDLYDICKMSCN